MASRKTSRGEVKIAEDYLFTEWNRARRLRDDSTGEKRRAYYALADHIQHLLEDYSVYGRHLVYSQRHRV